MRRSNLASLFLYATLAGGEPAPRSPITGSVTNKEGQALADATVVLLAGDRAIASTRSDARGRYRFDRMPDGAYRLLVISGSLRARIDVAIAGAALDQPVRLATEHIETIEAYEHGTVEMPPKVLSLSAGKPLPYSDDAIEGNHGGNALVLAFIDETGRVVAVRMVNSAGHGLDEIGIREVLAARFEAARDAGGRRVRSTHVIRIKWPVYWTRDPTLSPDRSMVAEPQECAEVGGLNIDSHPLEHRPCDITIDPSAVRAAAFHLPLRGPASSVALKPEVLVAELGERERRAICEWTAELGKPYGRPADPASCAERLSQASVCGLTVAEVVSCTANRAEDPTTCGLCGDR